MIGPKRPEPVPDRFSLPYWQHAREGRLAFQRCADCRSFQHPPGPLCRSCGGRDLDFEPVSGRGKVYTYTVTYHHVVPGFEEVPYVVAMIEMEEQPGLRVLSNVLGVGPESVRVGLEVEVRFEDLPGGLRLPQFTPRR